jgi:Uma2 family endonuclease
MGAPKLAEYDGVADHDHVVQLSGVTWADYERLLEIRGDHSVPRYTYLEGFLQIMSPSRTHESVKSLIGCLVEVWCLERGVEFHALGSWTIKERADERGAEPDECYVFGGVTDPKRPDLAIEVVWTWGGISKLEVYRKLDVPEVWYWAKGTISVHQLVDEHYVEVPESRVLPGIDLRQLERFIDDRSTSRAMLDYRAALRGE